MRRTFVGGLAFSVASVLTSCLLALPDEMFFESLYPSRPADHALGLPIWLGHKVLFGFGVGLLYAWARPSLRGSGWRRGMVFGLATVVPVAATYLGESAVLALPARLWEWWTLYYLIVAVVAGGAMGAAVERWPPSADNASA